MVISKALTPLINRRVGNSCSAAASGRKKEARYLFIVEPLPQKVIKTSQYTHDKTHIITAQAGRIKVA